nr:glycosyl hydrolase family 30 [Lutibacter sp.]
MKTLNYCIGAILFFSIGSCTEKPTQLSVEVFETSVNGNKLKRITEFSPGEKVTSIKILPEEKFQTITGFGGAFTESSAYLLNKV